MFTDIEIDINVSFLGKSYCMVPMLVGNLGNSWEFDLGHYQTGIGWEFAKFLQSDWEFTKNVLIRKMTSKIIQFEKMEKLGILLLKNHGYHVPCSFGLEMVGDEDLNSWEMIGIC